MAIVANVAQKQAISSARANRKGQFSKIISANEGYRLRCAAISHFKMPAMLLGVKEGK